MKQYLDLVKHILDHGERKETAPERALFPFLGISPNMICVKGFLFLRPKKFCSRAVVRELLWFLKGSTNINDGLKEYTPIWNAWADEQGELGPVYGYQWRKWEKFVWDARAKPTGKNISIRSRMPSI